MNFRRTAALALGLSLIGGAGQAQMVMDPGSYGPYLRAEGGWNHTSDVDIHGSTSSINASTDEKEGYIAGGALGYGFGNFRAELNLDYRDNSVRSVHIGSPPGAAATLHGGAAGSIEGSSAMLNGLLDLPYNFFGLTPYIGAGVGAVNEKLKSVSVAGTTLVDDSDNLFAMQAMVGVRYKLTDNWGLGLEYRFLNGFHPSFKDRTGNSFTTNDYRNSSLLLSISYSFGAPPPPPPAATSSAAAYTPPPPAPAPQPAPVAGARQLFLVFFDFDKSRITDAGRQVLDAAVDAIKRDQAVRIELTGYTDTVGTQAYNLNLSRKRADAVRDYLSKQGVPANRMDVAWKGKEDLRVPTPDGVREPQNRRVEIVMP